MIVRILGTAAGGGYPQWNCNCRNCAYARDRNISRLQTALAVSADGISWTLVNACPDLPQQISATAALKPAARAPLRSSPIRAVVLTGAEIDQIAGLLVLRERQPLALYAAEPVLAMLAANTIFDALAEDIVDRIAVRPGQLFSPRACEGLHISLFAVSGKVPLYAETKDGAGDGATTCGVRFTDPATGGSLCFVPACAAVTDDLIGAIDGASILLFDGTLFSEDELIGQELSHKTGARMGHVPMSGEGGAMAGLRAARVGRRMFIHINNSNPVLRKDSAERHVLAREGWEMASDGMELIL